MRIVAIDVDSPGQHAAMVAKLDLPFPFLSDPDRSLAIEPYGVADPKDPRTIAIPTAVLLSPDGEERYRRASTDFADRPTEDELLDQAKALELPTTTQDPPRPGTPDPGRSAVDITQLPPYYRGAKFAAIAVSRRFPETKETSKAYGAQMDRYIEAIGTRIA